MILLVWKAIGMEWNDLHFLLDGTASELIGIPGIPLTIPIMAGGIDNNITI